LLNKTLFKPFQSKEKSIC